MKSRLPGIISLVLILVIGIFFRFYKLGITPAGFYLDEAAMGYNAFSILKTGRDEFGKAMPLIFRSFLDFKTPVYTYFIVPLIPILGLSVFTTRFPSALFGVLTLPLIYLLIREITPRKYAAKLASLATLFMAISPWHILLSRTSYETNLSLFFLILGIYTFYLGLKKPYFFLISSLSLSISFLAYHAERLIVPIVFVFLIVSNFATITKNLRRYWLVAFMSIFLGLFLTLPTIGLMRTPGFLSRTTTLNIFSHSRQFPAGYKPDYHGPLASLINSPFPLSINEFASLYVSYFSPRYLFSIGNADQKSSYPDLATFFIWQLPFYLIGLYFLIKDKKLNPLRPIIILLLLVLPLPAAFTRDPYTTIRSLPLVVPQIIVISFGLIKSFELLSLRFRPVLTSFLVILTIKSLFSLYSSIFILNDYFRDYAWDFGPTKVVGYINKLPKNLPITFDNSRGESYIHLLFFTKYDPATYQKDNFEVLPDQYYTSMIRNKTKSLGRISYKQIDWGLDAEKTKQYLIGDGLVISDHELIVHRLTKIADINNPDGSLALRIVETNPPQNEK